MIVCLGINDYYDGASLCLGASALHTLNGVLTDTVNGAPSMALVGSAAAVSRVIWDGTNMVIA